jgi:prolyl-tRNA synthetase
MQRVHDECGEIGEIRLAHHPVVLLYGEEAQRAFFRAPDEQLDQAYQQMYHAYRRIFARCGLDYRPVEAESGPIGGDASHEFMVPAPTGESEVAYTEDGSYAANLEKANSQGSIIATSSDCTGELEKFATPKVKTIENLAQAPYNVAAEAQIKTLVFIAEDKPVIALVRDVRADSPAASAGFADGDVIGARGGDAGTVASVAIIAEVGSAEAVGGCRHGDGGAVPGHGATDAANVVEPGVVASLARLGGEGHEVGVVFDADVAGVGNDAGGGGESGTSGCRDDKGEREALPNKR